MSEKEDEMAEVDGVEAEVFRVQKAGDVVRSLFIGGEVLDEESDVVGDAVGCESGRHLLEWGFAAALFADVGDGDGGVHAEKDGLVGEEVSKGLDGDESREEFQGIDVKALVGGPVVESTAGASDGVEDASRGQV